MMKPKLNRKKTFKNALLDIMESIALEETALATIIKAEGKLLQAIKIGSDTISFFKTQKTVQRILRSAIKYQMLLQFKLEDVLETVTDIRNRICRCSLTGSGIGEVTNEEDFFYEDRANIREPRICADCGIIDNSFLEYKVMKTEMGVTTLFLKAFPDTIQITCPDPFIPDPTFDNPNIMVITGKGEGKLSIPGEEPITDAVFFTFTVLDGGTGPPGTNRFRMVISPWQKEQLKHDSGMVDLTGNLKISECPDTAKLKTM